METPIGKLRTNFFNISIRSPFSNNYFPPIEDGVFPPQELRELEIKLNKMFSLYKKAYYSPNAVSSVYLWPISDNIEDGLALSVLMKNTVNMEREIDSGIWDSSNVFSVQFKYLAKLNGQESIEATYKLTTTIILGMAFNHKSCGRVGISGSLTRQVIMI
jgi:capping protein beta